MGAEIIDRKRDNQRQWEESKMEIAKYNKRYKEIGAVGIGPRYLRKESIEKFYIGGKTRRNKSVS